MGGAETLELTVWCMMFYQLPNMQLHCREEANLAFCCLILSDSAWAPLQTFHNQEESSSAAAMETTAGLLSAAMETQRPQKRGVAEAGGLALGYR